MAYVTKLDIVLQIDPDTESIGDVVCSLPSYSAETFVQLPDGRWRGEFTISCAVAPEMAAGDFIDDFSPYFEDLLRLRDKHDACFELQIAVGHPAPESFLLKSHSVALLAALGASIRSVSNQVGEQSAPD